MKTFEKIYSIVSKIPRGKVMTYQQVAKLAGTTNPRIVGFAMKANKDTKRIPCHRVVDSKGKLRGYAFGGIEKKRELLEKERIEFLDYKTVNLEKSVHVFASKLLQR